MEQKIKVLATKLESVGISPEVSEAVAYGVFFKLMLYCWNNLTDVLGTSQEIDEIVGDIGLPDGLLCSRLRAVNLIGIDQKLFFCRHVINQANDTIRKRWYRNDKESYLRARSRGEADRVNRTTIEKPEVKTDLFGEELYTKRQTQKKGKTEHARLVIYWCEQWKNKYGNEYPFTKTDAKHIQQILTAAGGYGKAKRAIDGFLESKDRFHTSRSHRLGLLVNDLPRFSVHTGNEDSGAYPIL